jgi:dTMP kinase
MARGLFITLEGVEGSGKTTQARSVAAALQARGYSVELTREPGGTSAGRALRAILLDPANSLEPVTELLMMLADRAQHVREQLKPAIAAGAIVISDRYSDSTAAYQGYGRGFDLKLLGDLNRLATDTLDPDLTFVLDCPVELGLARTRARQAADATTPDRFENEQLEFHQRVRAGFLAIARENPRRVTVIDATLSAEAVGAIILPAVQARMAPR